MYKRNNKKMRIMALLLASLMCFSVLTACGEKPTTEGTAPVRDRLRVATMSETPSMGPFDHNAVAGSYVNSLVFATLFRTDEKLNPVPWIVDTYETKSDTEWEFKIKEGIKFHDGTDLKAADVAASLTYAKTQPEVSFYTSSVATVEAVGDYTVKITTNGPSATLLYDLCHHGNAVVPKPLIDSGNDFNKNPIGAGPYKFVKWTLGDKIDFEAFSEYFLGEPKIKYIEWKTIPEGSSRTIGLEAGEIDLIIEVEGMDVDRLEKNSKIELLRHDATGVSWLMLNNEKAWFANADVRHAINMAINKENVVTVALNNIGKPLTSQTPNGMRGSDDENADKYDIKKAKESLDKSGISPTQIEMSIICSSDQKKRAAEVIQSDLAQLGIVCKIENMDLATYLSTTAEGRFSAAIGGYSANDMVSYLQGVYHSKSINASNKSRFSNPEIDALIDKAATTVDGDAREKVLRECTAKLNSECPQIPLWQDIYIRAYNSELKGVAVNAGGDIHFDEISW